MRIGGHLCTIVTMALLAASTVTARAQTSWTGNTSNGWFNPGNWSNGVPTTGVAAIIDTMSPNPTEIRGTGAVAGNVFIGSTPGSNGVLTVTLGMCQGRSPIRR